MPNNSTYTHNLWVACQKYKNMQLTDDLTVAVPYYINRFNNYLRTLLEEAGADKEIISKAHELYNKGEVPFGRYRGKGTAAQIGEITLELFNNTNYSLRHTTAEGMRTFMAYYGLGIDCSGFVYNVIVDALETVEAIQEFNEKIPWPDKDRTGVDYAGATLLTKAADPISWGEASAGDVVCIKDKSGDTYSHIAIIIQNPEDDQLCLAHSAFTTSPYGVTITPLNINEGIPTWRFNIAIGDSWERYWEEGRIEIRRYS